MGYKAALGPQGRLLVDVDFYYNSYRDFIAQVEAYVPIASSTGGSAIRDPLPAAYVPVSGDNLNAVATALNARATQARYRLWTNSRSQVYNYGGSAGLRYSFAERLSGRRQRHLHPPRPHRKRRRPRRRLQHPALGV